MSNEKHIENDKHTEKGQPSQNQVADGKNKKSDVGKNWFQELRGSIMVVAVLIAGVTYTAGLSPPGGLWQDDLDGHIAGTPILRDKLPKRYKTFFYSNATAFMSSLVIIILMTNENVHESDARTVVMLICMVLDMVSMMVAYAAGSARSLDTSIYVAALGVVALVVVCCWTLLMEYVRSFLPIRLQHLLGLPKEENKQENENGSQLLIL